MRHQIAGKHLGRSTGQRDALRRTLINQFIAHERIHTTRAKAVAIRGAVEKLVTLAKRGSKRAMRRWCMPGEWRLPGWAAPTAVKRLFDEIAPRYEKTPGGYTRILRLGHAQGRRGGDGPARIRRISIPTARPPGFGRGMMARYQARIAYDGTAFRGFQAQPGLRTVEGELRSALATLGRLDGPLLAGGRTDTGVHAEGQVIAFDLSWASPVGELQRALNALLPDDISCPEARGSRGRFSSALHGAETLLPLPGDCHPLAGPAAGTVCTAGVAGAGRGSDGRRGARSSGKKDFGSFGSAPREGSHTIRTVLRAEWLPTDDALEFWIEADAFLFRMVRTITGTLLQVGGGRRTGGEFKALLAAAETPAVRGRERAAPPAPARGLCLMRIEYPGGKEPSSAK